MVLGLPSPLTCTTSTALQLLYDKLLNCFELCTKRTPRKIGTAAWEKFLTLEEFQELNRAKEAVDEVEIAMETEITRPLVEVRIECLIFALKYNYSLMALTHQPSFLPISIMVPKQPWNLQIKSQSLLITNSTPNTFFKQKLLFF
jgi:hypothetical protein